MSLNTEEQACIDARRAALKTAVKHLNSAARASLADDGSDPFYTNVKAAKAAIERAEEHDAAYDQVPA
jgi:hypothetical protein